MRDRGENTIQAKLSGYMIGTLAWTLCLPAGLAIAADISITQSGLHNGDTVYGLDITGAASPYLNADNYSMQLSGDDAVGYANVSFDAFGIGVHSFSAVNLQNQAQIVLDVSGGEAVSTAFGTAQNWINAYGIYSTWYSGNSGAILVSLMGETVISSISGSAFGGYADVDLESTGIESYFESVNNTGNISITTAGGTVTSSGVDDFYGSRARVVIRSTGIKAFQGVNNSGDLDVIASGGTSTCSDAGDCDLYVDLGALGIKVDIGTVNNSGNLSVAANGGIAYSTRGSGYLSTWANGIEADFNPVINSGDIAVIASGGTGTISGANSYFYVYDYATGIKSYDTVDSTGDISVAATGGTASGEYAEVDTSANGIRSYDGVVVSDGVIVVAATGGTASSTGSSWGNASSNTSTSGISSYGEVTSSGRISIAATGGSAGSTASYGDAYSNTWATGIRSQDRVENSADIAITITGGASLSAHHRAETVTEAQGIEALEEVDNSGDISITAIGGTTISDNNSPVTTTYSTGIKSESNVTNAGAISVEVIDGNAISANYSGNTNARALGIQSNGIANNSGGISVSSSSSSSFGDINSRATGIKSNGGVNNNGAISVSAFSDGANAAHELSYYSDAEAEGIEAYGDVNNSDAILVTAISGTASGEESFFFRSAAFGISQLDSTADMVVNNSGNISVAAVGGVFSTTNSSSSETDSEAMGISTYGGVNNSAVISVSSTGGNADANPGFARVDTNATGIESFLGDVNNSGEILVTAIGGSASSIDTGGVVIPADYTRAYTWTTAIGIDSDGDWDRSNITVDNSGDISVISIGGDVISTVDSAFTYTEAIGIQTDGTVNNSGDISVTVTGGDHTGEKSTANSMATGIYARAGAFFENFINNSGNIIVTDTVNDGNEALATGIDVYSGYLKNFVNNSGIITVTATAGEGGEASATGISFTNGGSLTNSGVIEVSGGSSAYEVAVHSGTVTLVDEYNLTLDGDPTVGSLYVAEGAELDLNGAMLGVTVAGGSTLLNTEYRIFDTDDGGTVNGAFGGLTGSTDVLNPDVKILYHDQATTDSADDTVFLSYQPAASPQLETVGLLRNAVSLPSNLIGQRLTNGFLTAQLENRSPRLYAAANTVADDAGPQLGNDYGDEFFFTPYYADIDREDTPAGYDGDLAGFVTGLDRSAGNSQYGFHLGYGHAGIDFTGNGYSGDTEDQELFSTGVHLMGNRDNWTWRGLVSGFYAWHDYDGLTGLNLEQHESADYDSYGLRTTLLGGHLFQFAEQMLLPEVGADYLWLHSDSFTTEADDAAWNLHGSSLDDHQVSALASLRWLTRVQTGQMEVTPSLAVGMRYLLTDDELEANQSVAGSGPVTVRAEQDKTTGTVSVSVQFSQDQLAMELAYDGEFGDDTTMHSAWLRFRYMF